MSKQENAQLTREPNPAPLRIIRIKEVMSMTGISRSHIYQLSSTGNFPKSVPLVPGGTSVGWVESEIADFLNQRIQARG